MFIIILQNISLLQCYLFNKRILTFAFLIPDFLIANLQWTMYMGIHASPFWIITGIKLKQISLMTVKRKATKVGANIGGAIQIASLKIAF